MIECILFDKNITQKDLIPFSGLKFTRHLFDPAEFKLETTTQVSTGDIITIIENRKPKFTGYITDIHEQNKVKTASGYDLRFLLCGFQYAFLYGKPFVDTQKLTILNTTFVKDLITKSFTGCSITSLTKSSSTSYTTEIRVKNIHEILRSCCLATNIYYELYAIGTKQLQLSINPIRDLRSSTPLLTNITHLELEKVISIKNKYNQILGLGAGEGSARDSYFVNTAGSEFPNCYVYNLREDITHAELVQRTTTKFKELQFEYSVKFKMLDNNVLEFDVDYGLGDYVSFKGKDGMIFDDLITEYETEIKNGVFIKNYEVNIGLIKGNLTDKLNELKEGGVW